MLTTRISIFTVVAIAIVGCGRPPSPGSIAAVNATGPAIKLPDAKTVDEGQFLRDFEKATALLQEQTPNGGFNMLCTATVFEKDDAVVRFVSAAHCVGEDDEMKEKVKLTSTKFYINFDDEENKQLLLAKVIACGYQHRGDDFAVLEVPLKEIGIKAVPVMPLATEHVVMGEPMANMASPNGLGEQLFRGHVSRPVLQRPIKDRDINWENAVLLQMNVAGGSSGSAVVSLRQLGIASFIVGHVGINTVAIPTERFVKFWELSKAGKYKWFKPDGQNDPSAAEADSLKKNKAK